LSGDCEHPATINTAAVASQTRLMRLAEIANCTPVQTTTVISAENRVGLTFVTVKVGNPANGRRAEDVQCLVLDPVPPRAAADEAAAEVTGPSLGRRCGS
jgi:hypothetical protein